MSRVENLIEQTAFLLEQQKEAKQDCNQIFTELLAFVEEKINESEAETEQAADLEKIHDMISGQAQKLADETDEDIQFLQEQLGALKDVARIQDPVKAHELLNLIIEEDEEILEFDEFKESVIQEATLSRQSLSDMVDDIKGALEEGGTHEVALLLESMSEQDGHDFDDEDLDGEEGEDMDYDDADDHEESDGCCSSSSSKSTGCGPKGCGDCSGGCSTGGLDLFTFVSKYEQDLAQDIEKDQSNKKKS